MSTNTKSHFGKVIRAHFGGVELELYILKYDRDKPSVVRCIDKIGVEYEVPVKQVKGDGSRKTKKEMLAYQAKATMRYKTKK